MAAKGIVQVISAQVLSGTTLTLGWLGYVPLLIWAVSRVRWVELFTDRRRQHLLFGTVFCLFALWLVRRDFDTGVSYHFIGMTAVTLLLDWPLAVLGGFMAQLGLLALGRQDLAALGVNGLLLIGLPVLITEVCALLVERAQPRNLFVYIFCSGFFSGRPDCADLRPRSARGVVAGRAFCPAGVAQRLCGLPVVDDVPRGVHQWHGDQCAGCVLPRVAGNLQPHTVFAGAVEGRGAVNVWWLCRPLRG